MSISPPENKTLGELFNSTKVQYDIDYYQREYKWQKNQVEDLAKDLLIAFKENEQNYYLGTLILSNKNNSSQEKYIIDGQQRLTTLTLLFIFFYNQYQRIIVNLNENEQVKEELYYQKHKILDLIRNGMCESEYKYSINVKERIPVIEYLLFPENKSYISKGLSDKQMEESYNYIENYLEEKYSNILNSQEDFQSLVNWVINNVCVVIIEAEKTSAYNIFETMNNGKIYALCLCCIPYTYLSVRNSIHR